MMLKKRALKRKSGEVHVKEFPTEKYWEGLLSTYRVVYLDFGDGEQYPIPSPVGELFHDLLQNISQLKREIPNKKLNKLLLYSGCSNIKIKDSKRTPLKVRAFLGR